MENKAIMLVFAALCLLFAANIVFLDITVFGVKPVQEAPVTMIAVPTATPYPTPEAPATPTLTREAAPSSPAVTTPKEYYIPLGSGDTKSDQWETLPGVGTSIDTTLYPKIKQVVFEAYLRIPVGIGWMHVKLFDVTDGHEVWGSELISESSTAQYKSAVISLDPGNKTYIVQALSTIRADAYVDNARIKIITY